MNTEAPIKKGWSVKRTILLTLLAVLLVGGYLLYANFNRLIADALMRTFQSHIISNVYELTFSELRVDPFEGSIRVNNVVLQPRQTPAKDYPYINSSFSLKTDELNLENVEILELLRQNRLNLEKIFIKHPDIAVRIEGKRSIFFPFSDSSAINPQSKEGAKKTISHFLLKSFQLIDASFHSINMEKRREFQFTGLRLAMDNLLISQKPGEDVLALAHGELTVADFDGKLALGGGRHLHLHDLRIGMDTVDFRNSVDTLIYKLHDANLNVKDIDIQTVDSLLHLQLGSFGFSVRNKSLELGKLSVSPNRSFQAMQKKSKYQRTDFAATAGRVSLTGLNVDSLLYSRKLLVDQVDLDSVYLTLYADLTKPRDPSKLPPFLGQSLTALKMKIDVKKVKASHVHLVNKERKPDGNEAEVHLTQATASLENVTNLSRAKPLVLSAEALLAGRTHFKATLAFNYNKPEFRFDGILGTFELPNLNPIIQSYTPASITHGVADEISFSGVAGDDGSVGTMKFLYHDLEVDIKLEKKAKWMSSVLAFTANTALHESNPPSAGALPKVVTFRVTRDKQKGFINLLIKSLLDGIKETMFMSKENKKAYKEAKKKAGK